MENQSNLTEQKKLRLNVKDRMILLIVGDVVLLFLSLLIAHIIWCWYDIWRFPIEARLENMPILWWLVIPWLLLSIISNSYSSENLQRLSTGLKPPIYTAVLVGFIYLLLYFVLPRDTLPRVVIVVFALVSCFLLMLWRLLHFKIFSNYRLQYKLWLIGDSTGIATCQKLINTASLHYKIVGITLEENNIEKSGEVIPTATATDNQSNHTHQNNTTSSQTNSLPKEADSPSTTVATSFPDDSDLFQLDGIVWAVQHAPTPHTLQCMQHCRECGLPIWPLPVFYETLMKRTPILFLQGWYLSFLPLQDAEWSGFYPIIKRMIDIICALFGLTILALMFPFIALAIKVTSHGPLFFSQLRVGKHGQVFRLWKFRTMIVDAEQKGAMWTQNEDARITSVGKILRKLHIDELPQLWNLLKGEISVVGVRPLTVTQCQTFQQNIPFHNLRHLVKPGLTGWAVVNYKHVNDLTGAEIRLEYDIYYVKHQAIWLDFVIMCRTVWTILTLNGL